MQTTGNLTSQNIDRDGNWRKIMIFLTTCRFLLLALVVQRAAVVSADCGSETEAIFKDPDVVTTSSLMSGAVSAKFQTMGQASTEAKPTLTLDVKTVNPQYDDYVAACEAANGTIMSMDTITISCMNFTAVENDYPACVGPSCTEQEVQEYSNENVLPVVKGVFDSMGLQCTMTSGDETINGDSGSVHISIQCAAAVAAAVTLLMLA